NYLRNTDVAFIIQRSKKLGFAPLFHCASSSWTPLSRDSDGRFRLRRSRAKSNPKPPWHSPRFHSRPATLTSPPFSSFLVPSVFVRWRQRRTKTGRQRQKRKKQ